MVLRMKCEIGEDISNDIDSGCEKEEISSPKSIRKISDNCTRQKHPQRVNRLSPHRPRLSLSKMCCDLWKNWEKE